MQRLLPHQVKYASGYKDKAFLVHEGGTGKTVCACVWLRDGKDVYALVVCPKRVVEKWKDALSLWQTKAIVLSKEQFKKAPYRKYSAIVIDEADEFASPLFTKSRSALSEKMYTLIKEHNEGVPVALLTATPIRSTPWNLHTLLCFLGIYLDWKIWREKFFYLQYPDHGKFRFLKRPAWMPKPTWRSDIRPYLEKFADIVLLKDCVDSLPPVQELEIKIKGEPFPGTDEVEPRRRFVEEHKHEQVGKGDVIVSIGKEYRKVLVVAYYVEQVEALAKELSKDRLTYMVHGGVKDQENILKEANSVDECFLVVQASLGSGFDADSFSSVVFASMSYAVRDYIQMKFRVRRIHNLHPVIYYSLIGGRCDRAVKNNVDLGKDFVPSEWSL